MLRRILAETLLKRQNVSNLRGIIPLLCRCQHTAEHDYSEAVEFRELVRDFAQRVVAPHAADIDKNNAFPSTVNLWTELGQMGLHGVLWNLL